MASGLFGLAHVKAALWPTLKVRRLGISFIGLDPGQFNVMPRWKQKLPEGSRLPSAQAFYLVIVRLLANIIPSADTDANGSVSIWIISARRATQYEAGQYAEFGQ